MAQLSFFLFTGEKLKLVIRARQRKIGSLFKRASTRMSRTTGVNPKPLPSSRTPSADYSSVCTPSHVHLDFDNYLRSVQGFVNKTRVFSIGDIIMAPALFQSDANCFALAKIVDIPDDENITVRFVKEKILVTIVKSMINYVPPPTPAAQCKPDRSLLKTGDIVAAKWIIDDQFYPAKVIHCTGRNFVQVRFLVGGLRHTVFRGYVSKDPTFGMCKEDREIWKTGEVSTYDSKKYIF